ncbi:MAG TPA: acyltransferase [Candidatus Dormibacteraeota bacterium]
MTAPRATSTEVHLPELDLLRATALLAVVFIHAASWVTGGDAPAQQGPYAGAMALARFSVPAFVLASGLALRHAYGRPADAGAFLRRRALRTLAPWLAWVPVYAVMDLIYGKIAPNPHDVVVWLAYGPGHLYFLMLVAQLSLLFPCLPSGRARLAGLAAGALVMQVALGVARTYAPLPTGPLSWPITNLPQIEAPFWVGWFLVGCALAADYERVRALSWLWPVALLVAVLGGLAVLAEATVVPGDPSRQGTAAFLWPSRLPAALAVAVLLLWVGRELAPHAHRLWTVVRALSRRSLGIYVIHVAVIEALAHTALIGLPPPLRLVVLMGGSLLIPYWLTGVLTRTSAGALALGEPGKVRWRPSGAG